MSIRMAAVTRATTAPRHSTPTRRTPTATASATPAGPDSKTDRGNLWTAGGNPECAGVAARAGRRAQRETAMYAGPDVRIRRAARKIDLPAARAAGSAGLAAGE